MLPIHAYDAIIVGAGGAGLMAALQICDKYKVALISKLHPLRSHTGAAQGGIAAALGNAQADSCEWHMYDTVKGGDYLGDQDAVEVLCYTAPECIVELEHLGVPFSRTPDGRINQRPFGGHTCNFGEHPVQRACYAADRTGHMILHTLFGQCLRRGIDIFPEFYTLDLNLNDGVCNGVTAYELASGEIHCFAAPVVLLATGGCGQMFQVTSNALSQTGDGLALVFGHGIPLQDMEFFQFHPTGLHPMGILITEGARGEGGVLRNNSGEAFMVRYASDLKDLAPRDLVTRAMFSEIEQGNGINGSDFLHLDLTKLPPGVIAAELPAIKRLIGTYLGLDPTKDFIPVQPTAHYAMGGIPTDLQGHVLLDGVSRTMPGLFAAGECAAVGVHGANRLGTNSLLETVVFGRRAGLAMLKDIADATPVNIDNNCVKNAIQRVNRLLLNEKGAAVFELRQVLKQIMTKHAGVIRSGRSLEHALSAVKRLQADKDNLFLSDKSRVFNTSLIEALELQNQLCVAETLVAAAKGREESRGAHYRSDFSSRDDTRFLKHSLIFKQEHALVPQWKPVKISRFTPESREY